MKKFNFLKKSASTHLCGFRGASHVLGLVLVLLTVFSGSAWGADLEILFSLTGTSGYSIPTGWSSSSVDGGNYFAFKSNGSYLTSPLYDPHNSLSLTFSVATYGGSTNPTNHNLAVQILNESNVVQATYYTATPTSTSYVTTGSPINIGNISYKFKIKFYLATANRGVRLRNITLTGEAISNCTAPTAVALKNGSVTSTGATLTVTDSENTNKYDFCCATSSTATKTVTASVSGSKEKAITGLNYGTTYYYWARTDCGSSTYSSWYPASNPSSFTTLCPAPTSVSAGSLTTSGVTFTITDNNDPKVNNYEIYYSTTNAEPGASPSGTATTTSETKAVTGLAAGTEFFFWVRSKGPNANSSWVSGGSFTTVTLSSITISTPPTTVDYLDGETFSKTGAVVTANYSNSTSATVNASWNKTTLSTSDESVTASYTENGVTKTKDQAIHVYSVTVLKQDEQGTAISADGVIASVSVRTLSASATDASKYVFKGWKYATDGEGGTTISGTSLSGTPTGNVTIIAEFYAPLTATWMVAGSEWTGKGEQTTFARGSHVSALPTAPNPANSEGCGDKFVGWTTVEEYVHNSSPLYTAASQIPNATTNQIFYAVFADYDE